MQQAILASSKTRFVRKLWHQGIIAASRRAIFVGPPPSELLSSPGVPRDPQGLFDMPKMKNKGAIFV